MKVTARPAGIRGNSAATRNARTATRSPFRYAALRHPEHAELIQRVLAIPGKRQQYTMVSFLAPAEIDALLAPPPWIGRSDHALLLLDIQTGLRLSELTGADRTGLRATCTWVSAPTSGATARAANSGARR